MTRPSIGQQPFFLIHSALHTFFTQLHIFLPCLFKILPAYHNLISAIQNNPLALKTVYIVEIDCITLMYTDKIIGHLRQTFIHFHPELMRNSILIDQHIMFPALYMRYLPRIHSKHFSFGSERNHVAVFYHPPVHTFHHRALRYRLCQYM